MPSDTYTLTISDAAQAIPADGSVTNAKIAADAAIAFSKLAPLSSGNILVGNASNVATSVNPSGDVDVSDTGVFSIAAGVVVNADINSAAAISISKLAAGSAAGQIIVAGANPYTPAYQTMSGDATLSGSGVLTIAANAVDSTKLKSDVSVDNNRAVTTDHIRSNAVTFAKLEAPAFSGLGVGGVLVGATSAQTYTKIPVNEIFLNSTGTGMLQASTKDAAAAAILPSFGANESKVLGLDLNGNLNWVNQSTGDQFNPIAPTSGGTGLTSYTTGDLLYCSSTNVLSKRAIGTNGQILSSDGALPVWISPPVGLPNQTGENGKFLTTNGTTASWAALPTTAKHAAAICTNNGISTPYTATSSGVLGSYEVLTFDTNLVGDLVFPPQSGQLQMVAGTVLGLRNASSTTRNYKVTVVLSFTHLSQSRTTRFGIAFGEYGNLLTLIPSSLVEEAVFDNTNYHTFSFSCFVNLLAGEDVVVMWSTEAVGAYSFSFKCASLFVNEL